MPPPTAQVIATFSQRMRVRMQDKTEADARIKGKRLRPVCGDLVDVEPIENEQDWLITNIHERRNALTRPNLRGRIDTLASNVELLLVVSAPSPKPDWFIVDRYLAAAENMGVPAAVVFNKTDLGEESPAAAKCLDELAAAGYRVLRCSAETGDGITGIASEIGERVAIVVGQSGVGKSSIINELMGGEAQRTAEISTKSGEGRHTTVNSVMLDLPDGGHVIDSPGVRDYAPALDSAAAVVRGFREIEAAGHDCRFANCRHLQEPGCAVKAGVDEGSISARRYESYRRLLRLTEELEAKTRSS
jgi:ribosome biogenesis GTPase